VVVNYALEKYLLEKSDMTSCVKILSHLCKQRQLLIRSFPFSMHFSRWHVNKTNTTDFKACKKKCTRRLTNACS